MQYGLKTHISPRQREKDLTPIAFEFNKDSYLLSKIILKLTEGPQGIEIVLPDKKQIKRIALYVRKHRGGDLETRLE